MNRRCYFGPGYYRHYRGGDYYVVGLAREESSKDVVVVYLSVPGDVAWTRSKRDFDQWFTPNGMDAPEDELVPRFAKTGEPKVGDLHLPPLGDL